MNVEVKEYSTIGDAFNSGKSQYKYALIYIMSQLLLCKTSELPQLQMDEMIEVRLFDSKGEQHIYQDDFGIRSVTITDDQGLESVNKSYIVSKEFQKKNEYASVSKLQVKKYIDYDEDGQGYIKLTRCYGIEEGGE